MNNLNTAMIKKTFKEGFPKIKFSVRKVCGCFEEAVYVKYIGNISTLELTKFSYDALPNIANNLLFVSEN
jgi:hypothetical protein